MRYIIIFIFIVQIYADSESCNMKLVSSLQFGQGVSDITGFMQDGREFAVVGLVEDIAAFVDITDPQNPFELAIIDMTSDSGCNYPAPESCVWRDLKYWNRHVYIGSEAAFGVQVISVNDPDNPVIVNTITDFQSSHNIHIDLDGYLYVVGAEDSIGVAKHDIWIYNLNDDPSNPDSIGAWNGEYLHDIEVYNNKIYGAAIYSGLFYIIDVRNKTNPTTLISYDTGGGYISTHDCSVTDDENYLITADETLGGHIKIWDISNYNNINLVSEYMTHPNHSIHNVYIRPTTNLAIMSYYVDGTQVLDLSDPENPVKVGYFDTSDLTDLYDGNWGTYAYLPSGYIISSDRQNGLFIIESPLTNPSMEWIACVDCANVANGEAYLDDCDVCSGGTTGHEANLDMDECGVCYGIGATIECSDGSFVCDQTDCLSLSIDNTLTIDAYPLLGIYPNPFNPLTIIEYSLSHISDISLIVYDLFGRPVAILQNGIQPSGHYRVTWDAGNHSSGMYFINIVTEEYNYTQKLTLMK